MLLQPLANNAAKRPTSRSTSVPAPIKGWNAKDSLADMDPEWAIDLENMFPHLTDVELRGGSLTTSTGNGSAVETLVEYAGAVTRKLLSASGASIYDSSASGASTEIATGKTSARWQTTMFTTAGGSFLYFVNGADAPIYYDGSSFTTPTLSGVTATDIIHVTTHQRRLFFTFKDSLTFGYLAVNSIAGAVSTFDIGGLCEKGGHLVACGSWTRDGGSGPDDVFVAVTSEGECVLYSGNDPGTASAWTQVGVFSIGKPIGRRCLEKVGSDLIVITQDGAIPLAPFLPIDQVGSKGKALSDNIQNHFVTETRKYGSLFGWQSIHYPQGSYAAFNVPHGGDTYHQYVVNTQTGAWCKFTGQNALCWSLFNGDLYFGSATGGTVKKADTGVSDDGANINWKVKPAFNYYGTPGIQKLFNMCRPHFRSNGAVGIAIDLNVDFSDLNPTSVPTTPTLNAATWDVSNWDEANWADEAYIADWITVYGMGDNATPTIRGATNNLTLSFSAYDMIWQVGNAL